MTHIVAQYVPSLTPYLINLSQAPPTHTPPYLCVVGDKKGGGAIKQLEVFGEEPQPGVVAEENQPLAGLPGLPDEVVLQQGGRVQVHHHVDEAWDAARR